MAWYGGCGPERIVAERVSEVREVVRSAYLLRTGYVLDVDAGMGWVDWTGWNGDRIGLDCVGYLSITGIIRFGLLKIHFAGMATHPKPLVIIALSSLKVAAVPP